MELPNPGSYQAQQNGTVIIRKEQSGSIMAYIPFLLLGSNFSETHNLTLGARDGTLQQKNIETLKAVFPNWNPEELEDIPMPDDGSEPPKFELADCYHDDSYVPEGAEAPVIQFRAKWFNVVGGGRRKPMTDEERKAAVAGWKVKVKGLFGKSAKPAATKPAVAQSAPAAAAKSAPVKAASSGPPSRKTAGGVARTSTQEEVWNALVEANPDVSEEENGQKFYEALDAVVPGSSDDPSVLTPTQWGAIAVHLGQ